MPEAWSFLQGSRSNNTRTEKLTNKERTKINSVVQPHPRIPKQTQINIHEYKPSMEGGERGGEEEGNKMLEMHKHIRLMCGTSLHIQSCCAFCLQGSAEAEAFKSHMIYYSAKC